MNEIARSWRELYEKGNTALQRNNLDYALTIFNQILQKEPGFYECREALRATQYKKAGSRGGFFKRVLGTASSSPLLAKGQLQLRSNPLEAINIAEQILTTDPNNNLAHKLLAEAASAADLPKTAVLSLEILAKHSPKDREISLKLGEALAQAGEIARAESIYAELQRANPGDNTIAQALKNLSANRTMQEGGYEALAGGEGSYRDILKDKAEAVSLEQESRQVKSDDVAERLIEEYEARIPNEPSNLKLLRSVAELCTQKKEFDKALEYYNRIMAAEGIPDPALERAIAETTARKFDHLLGELNPQAPDYAEQSAKLQAGRQAYLIADCRKRVERYPNDLQARFELGQVYFEAGKISEAIQEFQKAQSNPHRRVQAMSYLGQCFSRRGMNDLAARTLQNALKEKLVFDEEKKDLIYLLGSVLEKMGQTEEAIEQFKQIYEVDIGYRDVAGKVDAYYASKGSA
ncbi:MAG: tetratricopeptide repeat protein [Chloroflexi bacterium]|nr:tetratricopeptide repeat protein [Chloroflexota bacterium]